jgi:hypothetical protein
VLVGHLIRSYDLVTLTLDKKDGERPKGPRKNNFTFLCADASCLAALPKRRNISIFQRFGALPGRRLNT